VLDDSLTVLPCLKRLGLASVIRNPRVFNLLLKVLKHNRNLIDIDLSWNGFLPDMVEELIKTISRFG
jgi:hypothetical protein